MRIELPYGTDKISFEIAKERLAEIVSANEVKIEDETALLTQAIENPIDSESLEQFLADAQRLLVLVNDASRPTPTARILSLIRNRIKQAKDYRIMVATGNHRAPTPEEYLEIFGDLYAELKDRIYAHDSKAEADLAYIGKSRAGTEMYINKMALWADKFLPISSVEPHYFAGFTGGRKSFLPGIAGYQTITQNHKYSLDPRAKPLALAGNPIHEDMEDAIKTINKPVFSIQTVLDAEHRVYGATAGDLNASFYAAIHKANDVYSVKIKEKAEIVITVAPYPMDIDLYQSQKAIEQGRLALKENGILILVSKCRMGVGDDRFVQLLSQVKTPQEVLKLISDVYQLGDHKAAKIAELCQWAQIWGLADVDPELLKSVFIKPCSNIQTAVDEAFKEQGPSAKLLILMQGSLTVPRL